MFQKGGGHVFCTMYLHVCIWQTLLSKVTNIALHIYIPIVLAFLGNQTHDLGIEGANALLFELQHYTFVCVSSYP